MQGKLFQWCTHLLYCSVLSLGGNVNTRRMSQLDMGSIFNIKKNQLNILVIGNYSEPLNNEYIERIHQMSYSSLSDNGMLQIFSFLIK